MPLDPTKLAGEPSVPLRLRQVREVLRTRPKTKPQHPQCSPLGISRPASLPFLASGALAVSLLGVSGQAAAGIIPNGGALSGSISVDGEIDVHSFSGSAGQRGLVSISGSITSGEYFEVYNPDGTSLTGSSSHIRIDLAQSGTYEVRVRSFQSRGTGNYQVHLALAAGANEHGLIPNGGSVSETIDADGEIDSFTFQGAAGQNGLISISGDVSTGEYFYVFNPDGTVKLGDGSHTRIDLDQTGTYTVVVQSFQSRGTGNYQVHLALAPGANEHGLIANGGSVSETIDADGEIDSFVFFGRSGGEATIELTSMITTGGYIYVFAPDGTPVAGTGSSQRFALTSSGAYTVVVQSFQSRGTGDYMVRLDIAYTIPPTTEVLFVNGIFTFAEAARDAAIELEVRGRQVMSEEESQRVRFGLIYNRTFLLLDLFETYQQLQAQEGRSANFGDLGEGYLLSRGSRETQIGVAAALLISDITAEIDTQRAVGRIRVGQTLNDRTVLLGYSQGNLFVNEAYARLDPLEQARTSALGVATPALRTADGGPNTTLCGDAVINGLLLTGFMPLAPNAAASPAGCSEDFLNHSFTGAYLACSNTQGKLMWELRNALQLGNATPSHFEGCR